MSKQDDSASSVLFVDDEAEIVRAFSEALNHRGLLTRCATDPFRAIEMVEESHYDVAIIDLVMPGMDGIELVHRILPIDPAVRCVILTAHGGVDACDRAYRSGVVRFLEKPITVQRLYAVVNELLDSSRLPLASLQAIALMLEGYGKESDCSPENPSTVNVPASTTLDVFRQSAIKRYLVNASKLCKGNPKLISRMAGISMATVYRLLSEHQVPFSRRRMSGKGKRKNKGE